MVTRLRHLQKKRNDGTILLIYRGTIKNLQPDGSVILSAGVKITDHTFSIILPASYDFNSIKRNNDHFAIKRLQLHDD